MNKEELNTKLEENKIPQDAYSLEGGLPSECFCMETGDKCVVYYSERGIKTQLREFGTESEACDYMYKKLLSIF